MFQSIVISPDRELGNRLVAELQATGHVAICKNLTDYPTALELTRMLRAHSVEVLFLSFESIENALKVIEVFEGESIPVPIVGFHRTMDPRVLHESMRAGVREFLAEPLDRRTVMQSLAHVKTLLEKQPVHYPTTDHIYTFLPARAGVGTSTVAANVSSALARRISTRVLLADFDLNSGMLRFMLKLKNEFSVTDAVAHALDMDENLWRPLVADVEGMDVLHAGHINPNFRIDPKHIRSLVAFVRRHYGALCFDVSGNLEKYSLELMQESKRIFLVSTPEVASLHAAREKITFLKEVGLDHRISVVLTRLRKDTNLSERELADVVGAPVIRAFPNDYLAVQHALNTGNLLPKTSKLGEAFTEFADDIAGQRASIKPNSYKRKFLEFITPVASRTFGSAGA